MKNIHRLSLMVLTVLTAAFLIVDLPLMAQMGGQQRRGQQGAPQQPKGAQQGAPKGAGTAQIDKSSPKVTPQQEQRVGQLRQQAQSLFRNLKQVLGELQRLSKRGTQGLDVGPVTNPNPRGPQQRPGQQRGTQGLAESSTQNRGYGATSNPSGGVVDGDRLAQTGRNDAAFIKFDGLKQQAQQIVNNFAVIENEAKSLGFQFTRTNQTVTTDLPTLQDDEQFSGEAKALQQVLQTMSNLLPDTTIEALQQMGKELKEFGVAVPAASFAFQERAIQE